MQRVEVKLNLAQNLIILMILYLNCVHSLLAVLAEHLNAEIVAGTVTSKQDALDYVTWTYFFRRLVVNPRLMMTCTVSTVHLFATFIYSFIAFLSLFSLLFSYYQLEDAESLTVNTFLTSVVDKALIELQDSYCIEIEEVCVCMHLGLLSFS